MDKREIDFYPMSNLSFTSVNLWPHMKEIIDEVLSEGWFDPFTVEMVKYQLASGGKRIRPWIAVTFSRIFNGNELNALYFGTSVELIHNASLVHDDIQDGDTTRRGQASAWKKYSMDQAINLGDALFALAFEVFKKCELEPKRKLELMEFSMRTVGELVNGQVKEIFYRQNNLITPDEYLHLVSGKTGSLFRLACRGAVMLAQNGAEAIYSDLDNIGTSLGNMFQIRDDIIDVFGLKEGRPAGSDIKEGKPSILSSLVITKLTGKEKEDFISMYFVPTKKKTKTLIKKIIKTYHDTGVVSDALEMYMKEKDVMFSINLVKENSYLKLFLQELCDYLSLAIKELYYKT